MPEIVNSFGSGFLHTIPAGSRIYAKCTACLSIYSEICSWAEANKSLMVSDPGEADCIIVTGCQVTDLSVLNDLLVLESLQKINPSAKFYIGGCLARRFDIALPDEVDRLDHLRSDGQSLPEVKLVNWDKPYWVKDFDETKNLSDGSLFRNSYPLRIGVGCKRKCAYCTIRETRGEAYQIPELSALVDFIAHENVLLVADSPSAEQIKYWINKSILYNKPISIRNIEPHVAFSIFDDIKKLAKKGLLKTLHSPIQSDNIEVLKDMRRNIEGTLAFIYVVQELKEHNVVLATNIITDYKDFDNPSERVYNVFDYVSWNPYWDGKWDRKKAEERFYKYFPWKKS